MIVILDITQENLLHRFLESIKNNSAFLYNQNRGAPAQPAAAAPAPAAPANGAAAPNGASGAADYSAQWAEYYRSVGKHKEAEAIEAQIKQKVNLNYCLQLSWLAYYLITLGND